MFADDPEFSEITVPNDLIPDAVCQEMFQTDELTKLTIKGNPSDEFIRLLFPLMEDNNRYIGEVNLEARVELDGADLEDGMFSYILYDGGIADDSEIATARNDADGKISFGTVKVFDITKPLSFVATMVEDDSVICETESLSRAVTLIEWGSATPSATEMFFRTDNLEKIKVSEGFKPSVASEIFHVADYSGKQLTITGTPSQEFKDTVYPTLKDSNRYVGYVKLRSKIELEGKDLEDGMFGISLKDDRKITYGSNLAEDNNIIEISARVYAPGENTFTVEEIFEPSGGENYVSDFR